MMFKKILLPLVLMIAAGAATADDYTYVAGGGQLGSGSDGGIGLYLNGSYGFNNNLFFNARVSGMAAGFASIREDMLGAGYHYALSDSTDLYALAGISNLTLNVDFLGFSSKDNIIGPTGESGLNIKLTPDISVNSALRLTGYRGSAYYRIQLGTSYALTEHISAEAGYQYHYLEKTGGHFGTLGLRYTF